MCVYWCVSAVQLSQRLKEQNAIEQHLRDEIVRLQHEKLEGERRFNVKVKLLKDCAELGIELSDDFSMISI